MKKNNPYFHRILLTALCTALAALCSCTGDTDIDSIFDNVNSPATGTPLEVRATVAPFQSPDASTSPATRAAIDNISTKFQTGDAIGLICFRNGATGQYISEDISNLKLVFTETTDGAGTWKTEGDEDPIYYTDAVSYMAYYPYTPDVNLSTVTNEMDAETAIADALQQGRSSLSQYTYQEFATSDFMISVDIPREVSGTHTLTMNFEHQCLLIIVKPMGKARYSPPTGVIAYEYHPKATAGTDAWGVDDKLVEQLNSDGKYRMMISGVNAYPMSDGSYAALVIPDIFDALSNIQISYKTNGGALDVLTYGSEHTASYFAAGSCHVLEVHHAEASGIGGAHRDLKPGDFVLQQNNKIVIYPGDGAVDATTGKIPDYTDAVGIVVTTSESGKMTDQGCIWTNAYVMGLENIPGGPYQWGTENVASSLPVISPGMGQAVLDDMNGYSETETMMLGELNKLPIFNALSQYRIDNPIQNSISCSPWFIPSVGQWLDVMANLCGRQATASEISGSWGFFPKRDERPAMFAKADSQLAKVGTSLFGETITSNGILLHLSTEAPSGWSWVTIAKYSNSAYSFSVETANKATATSEMDYYTARPFFAF